MRRIVYLFFLSFFLVSCGTRKGHFKIEGRFLHINQGELYIYSPDGGIAGIDTIKIEAGRFAYETTMNHSSTLMLVFPNFSEHPVFAESGGSVEIRADASHLKEMTVKGTDENNLMNSFREQTSNASPPEEKTYAELFIKDHPKSLVSAYLVRKYFILSQEKDYQKAYELISLMTKEQPDNVALGLLQEQIRNLAKLTKGNVLPFFSATDIYGEKITSADLKAGDAVIFVWASWAHETLEVRRALNDAWEKSGGKVKIVGICVDANKEDCRKELERNKIGFPVICDGQMLDSELLSKLGIAAVPDNIVLHNGRITDRGIPTNELRKKYSK